LEAPLPFEKRADHPEEQRDWDPPVRASAAEVSLVALMDVEAHAVGVEAGLEVTHF
jgi:hypothetical protein